MKISGLSDGTHTTVSPCGRLIACIANEKIVISDTEDPARGVFLHFWVEASKITSVKWSPEGTHVVLLTGRRAEIISIYTKSRMRLDNGSNPLGSLTSIDFVGTGQVLATWEFGHARTFSINSMSMFEVGELKSTCQDKVWARRFLNEHPRDSSKQDMIAHLERHSTDVLSCGKFTEAGAIRVRDTKLPTVDAQEVSWSPDGEWIAVLDTPASTTGVYFYTPMGDLFKTFPRAPYSQSGDLGIKAVTWSPAREMVALSGFHGEIAVLDTRKFLPYLTLSHDTTIDTNDATVWRETVSASGQRAYEAVNGPAQPILTSPKPSTDPRELGVAELCISNDGRLLASRDERFLSTIFVWDLATGDLHAVFMQHKNVRKMQWHPDGAVPHILLFDCGENIAYVTHLESCKEPEAIRVPISGAVTYTWVPEPKDKLVILAATKSRYALVSSGHSLNTSHSAGGVSEQAIDVAEAEGQSNLEDSVQDILTGRKPPPEKTMDFSPEMVDLGADLDDTFQGKQGKSAVKEAILAHFDDDDEFF